VTISTGKAAAVGGGRRDITGPLMGSERSDVSFSNAVPKITFLKADKFLALEFHPVKFLYGTRKNLPKITMGSFLVWKWRWH